MVTPKGMLFSWGLSFNPFVQQGEAERKAKAGMEFQNGVVYDIPGKKSFA